VSESDDATAQAVCLPSVSVNTDGRAHVGAVWPSMRPILDHREAVVPNAAHSLRERRRAMARRRRLFADQWGYACARSSCQPVCMCVRLHVCVPAPMGACVCVCARECAHVCFLGNELRNQMPCLSLSSAEASPTRETLHCKSFFSRTLSVVDATDSRTTRTSSGASRVSVSGGATAQAVCLPWVSGHTDACTHIDVGWRRDRFSTVEKR
jgi:hypothetical protein